ncbi:MAG: PilZ domain-containing protein [Desulfobulbaceae bacterium]|uniref:PilZ domain-containing protein n=1 Tax=Candidatus Desulfobia pelagia TaxID=2841692 RepID=A0A8J6TH40_9BACT|nr:PilZ domain-containing protein [Candidatus Desulfobia pelagia]
MKTTAQTERRHSKRQTVKSGIVALLQPDRSVEIGNIIDFNHNGLSFIIESDKCTSAIKDAMLLDILLINENIFLEHVTTSISSKRIYLNDPRLNRYHAVSRYGVKFENIESAQERQLRKLAKEICD